jgi:hypothetical protein
MMMARPDFLRRTAADDGSVAKRANKSVKNQSIPRMVFPYPEGTISVLQKTANEKSPEPKGPRAVTTENNKF